MSARARSHGFREPTLADPGDSGLNGVGRIEVA